MNLIQDHNRKKKSIVSSMLFFSIVAKYSLIFIRLYPYKVYSNWIPLQFNYHSLPRDSRLKNSVKYSRSSKKRNLTQILKYVSKYQYAKFLLKSESFDKWRGNRQSNSFQFARHLIVWTSLMLTSLLYLPKDNFTIWNRRPSVLIDLCWWIRSLLLHGGFRMILIP